MILLSSILAAHAAPALRKVCLEAQVSYEDVGVDGAEEDYFQTNANRPLRGAKLFYKKSADPTYTAAFVDHGSDAGCVWLTVDDAVPYDLKIATLARVNDHDISVVQSQSGLPWEATWSSQSFASGVTKVLTVGPNRAWNVLAASGFALHRRDGGLANTYDPTFHLTNNAGVLDAPSCGDMSCVVGTDIYLTDDLANRKFPTVYAMGISFLNHEGLTSGDVDESADNATCGPSSSAVALQSLEHDSAAAVAGYAWFYAATVFNHTTEGDCGMTSWLEADWDMLGGECFDEVESPADHAFSCADGPSLVPRRNQIQYCIDRFQGNDPAADRTVPLDWLRFLWALQSSGAEDFADITSAYATAIGHPSWSATGSGVQTAFGDTGGLLATYATLAAEHGVTP